MNEGGHVELMNYIRLLSMLGMAAILAGCGGGSNLSTVTGTVTMDGAPVEAASVAFTPEEGSQSFGVTDASGHYELYFAGDTKGAVTGKHTVRITTPSPSEDDPRQYVQIPARYNTETELTATVEKGSNTIDFALKSE
ncbi:MAG: carboxypeptidase-like regulatory domain-containing protein [Planctomycetes bacterium]|nr:carboxypeptidase-like regulatory domain-containing protein [Planctomycetota bacterium]